MARSLRRDETFTNTAFAASLLDATQKVGLCLVRGRANSRQQSRKIIETQFGFTP